MLASIRSNLETKSSEEIPFLKQSIFTINTLVLSVPYMEHRELIRRRWLCVLYAVHAPSVFLSLVT